MRRQLRPIARTVCPTMLSPKLNSVPTQSPHTSCAPCQGLVDPRVLVPAGKGTAWRRDSAAASETLQKRYMWQVSSRHLTSNRREIHAVRAFEAINCSGGVSWAGQGK